MTYRSFQEGGTDMLIEGDVCRETVWVGAGGLETQVSIQVPRSFGLRPGSLAERSLADAEPFPYTYFVVSTLISSV